MSVAPPRSEAELVARADAIAGYTLGELARTRWIAIPDDPRRAKGWAGGLLEQLLGATAASRAEPDFPHLGIELKTVPIDPRGVPTESTYVCTMPLDPAVLGGWDGSWVRRKLGRVLWIPLGGADAPGDRVVGAPIVWSPTADDDAALRADWDELVSLVASGELWQVDGRRGRVLQVRPKAQDADDTVWALDEDAGWVRETPRGFYLRPSFTREILRRSR
ncbi:MAG: DNA mismatch repair endonuclease MutH [Myxococcota bacterium]